MITRQSAGDLTIQQFASYHYCCINMSSLINSHTSDTTTMNKIFPQQEEVVNVD